MARYYIETYGCTANRGESRHIERRLRDGGHRPVESPEAADVVILNTCTVIETTENNMLRRATELDSGTDLIVTGCMALAQETAFEDAGVDAQVLGWDEVPQAVGNGECPTVTPDTEPILDGVIGILPLARGCMSDCSYCITKAATGRIDSPPVERNLDRARELLDAGAQEIRITGQDTGVYGLDQGERWLPELLRGLCDLDGDFRVRIGMANPWGIYPVREEIATLLAECPKLYNFLHLPVQSGSDSVLDAMRRQHSVAEFREIVNTLDRTLDEWTLATDFVVGFPTETEADHQESVDLLEAVEPETINVTRFSKRPGTDAAEIKGLGGTVKKERSKDLSARKEAIVGAVHEDLLGTRREVMAVEPGTGDSIQAYDDAYHRIVVPGELAGDRSLGERFEVTITDHNTFYAFGEPV
ncbi:tRNA (N(6)-L-threonylcarbamoyladenosine(37)-C(2))-methylthiotransferase [Halodesulfurarchaeum sp. HSR-GB]|uniref:tRNA (N(6)-L-threonylcarbamoyladenosine(37)-C(2))- methylthiotransferase n=1 Tax=Halodesulfurarchaeum sp. HSR-GB TaxID=3074077 RepID=UPI00286721E3|nr:tRNA (N(6)-L-threonylcarbamoyladenosine(37)-C(2))-methylthiotransferase [Halodesulfurarchaeum sp. HSR-GB]MDR5656353.1 tRNA (N(6)-L-threonylcarbamoyladenosine(37)-C(2))-methylthiotransferase [Halodesulfurarchaeum sp. HSR-GB]